MSPSLRLGSVLLTCIVACNSSTNRGAPTPPRPRQTPSATPTTTPPAASSTDASADTGAVTVVDASVHNTPSETPDDGATLGTTAVTDAATRTPATDAGSQVRSSIFPDVAVRSTVSAEGLHILWLRNNMVEIHGNDVHGNQIPELYQNCAHYRSALAVLRQTVTPAQAALFGRVCTPGNP